MTGFTDFGVLGPWLEAPGDMMQAIAAGSDGWHGLADSDATPAFPLFRAELAQSALFDAAGALLAASPRFRAQCDPALIATAASHMPDRRTPGAAVKLVSTLNDGGTPVLMAYAPAPATAGWHLPAAVRQAMLTPAGRAGVVVLTTEGSISGRPLEDAARAFGFNGLETRVAVATVECGSIRAAAERLDIAYQTAREAIAGAMNRAGVSRLPVLVTLLAELGFGVLPRGTDDASLLADVWGITPRQAALGVLVAGGLERGAAAAALGLSAAVAKKEIDLLYETLGVGSAAALARALAEANALQWMMQATGGVAGASDSIGTTDSSREPLRLARRADGSRVAWSDYGPASGRPVLVVHSSMTTRFVSRRLVRALQAKGFRPIAIDRPGFGLTDPVAGTVPGQHNPFEVAVADVVLVARQARVRRLDVVSRGAAHHLLALGRAVPDLLGRVVITNPDPDSRSDPRRTGALGTVKEAYLRRPALVRAMARLLATQLTAEKFPRLLARTMEGSPPDEAAMGAADIVEDYWRSVRPFATGRFEGYVSEQMNHATMPPATPLAGTHDWHFMVAEHDVLYDPAVVMEYWQRTLPDASHETLPGSGRLMAMTHADIVADRLAQG